MAQKMKIISLEKLLSWIFEELTNHNSIFGINLNFFYRKQSKNSFNLLYEDIENPFGPAAGPHTQLSQNIISSYLVGGRFIELKTVQFLDSLEIDKPCIDMEDEGYNVEWSQELSIDESVDEYLKSYLIIHLLKKVLNLSNREKGFIYNISVGYDLKGIKSEKVDKFISLIKDAKLNPNFERYKSILIDFIIHNEKFFPNFDKSELVRTIENISPVITKSVTLSTMHGCPREEIESIAKYLIKEKELNTYIKLNPTLLGYERVKNILSKLEYDYIALIKDSFEHDIQFHDAIPMIERLQNFSSEHNKIFGIKLSNTLGVLNTLKKLPGEEMYMSGRSLFPLAINLAYEIAKELNGKINISYSGGASLYNSKQIIDTGIYPVTYATELLKPGGYMRLKQIVEDFESKSVDKFTQKGAIDLEKLKSLAENSLEEKYYKKSYKEIFTIRLDQKLKMFDCYVAPCQIRCPIHQDVSRYVNLVALGKYDEALEVIAEKNPLPHITGYICDHQCETQCTRWEYDWPIKIRDIKKFAVENAYGEKLLKVFHNKKLPDNNIKIAIIGAGPAGLAAAYFLRRAGFDVTCFEKRDKAGGIVRYIIPKFRIPQEVIDKDINFISSFGVKFEFNAKNISIQNLKTKFKYVFIGIGAEISKELNLGNHRTNVFDALDFLRRFNKGEYLNLGSVIAVIGGGNSAMDAARAAIRCEGVEKVMIVYRRTKKYMPADREEIESAIMDGVEIKELLQPVSFENECLVCQKMMLGNFDSDGRQTVVPIKNQFELIKTNSIITAIGEQTDFDFLKRNSIQVDEKFKIDVNPDTNETNLSNVFIGGDALRGPSTVIESIADGKKVAEEIISRENLNVRFEIADRYKSEIYDRAYYAKGNIIFETGKDLIDIASRCLACDLICNKCVDVCPNRANFSVRILDGFRDHNQIIHIDGMCNDCGNCETFCPYTGAPYKDKLTIFWSENDFIRSRNDGFVFQSDNEVILRFKNKIQRLNLRETKYLDDKEQIWNVIKKIKEQYSFLLQP